MSATKKFLPPIIFAIILNLVVWRVEPPESITQASFSQLALFFIPLLLLLTFLINLYTKLFLKSFVLSIGLILILVIKTLDFFIFLSIPVVVITLLMAKYLKKPARKPFTSKSKTPPKPRLLKMPVAKPESAQPKIPKLSRLSKHK